MSGTICTFYSYKGGVGRSFALVNVAAVLAQWGHDVLCIDWDLEAPGLHLFFEPYLQDAPARGVVELIADLAADRRAALDSYVTPAALPGARGRLDVMAAGRLDDGYVGRVQALDWDHLYAEDALGERFEELRGALKADYDFVLLDSRTGITDVGGICTVQLPDLIAFCFTPNHQSLNGVLEVMRRAEASRQHLPYDRAQVPAFPVITRFEATIEVELARKWMGIFEERLEPMLGAWKHRGVEIAELLTHLRIPHVAHWSFGERLPVIEEGIADPLWIGYAFETLAAVLGNRLERTELLVSNRQAYVDAAAGPSDGTDPFPHDVFVSYGPSDRPFAAALRHALAARGVNVANDREARDAALSLSRNLVYLAGVEAATEDEAREFTLARSPATPRLLIPVLRGDQVALPAVFRDLDVVDGRTLPPAAVADSIALTVFAQLAELRPDDADLRRRQVALLIATGDLDRARSVADAESLGEVEAAAQDWARAADRFSRGTTDEAKVAFAGALAAMHREDDASYLLMQCFRAQVERDGREATLLGDAALALASAQSRVGFATEIVDARADALGASHPSTLRAQATRFALLCVADPASAAQTRQREIEALAHDLGERHPATLDAKASLAGFLVERGDGGASQLRREVFEGFTQTAGSDRPETLRAGFELVDSLPAGDEASELGEELLARARARLSPTHPIILAGTTSLAAALLRAGRVDDAAEEIHRELAGARDRLGDNHVLVVGLLTKLAAVHWARGYLEEARELEEALFTRLQRVLGADHPDTLAAMSNLALTYHAQGDLEAARTLQEGAFGGLRKLHGLDHTTTQAEKRNLAVTLADLGELGRATELLREVVDWRRRESGPDHLETVQSLVRLGDVLVRGGDIAEGAKCHLAALESLRTSVGRDHPDTLVAQQRYALAQWALGDVDEARAQLTEVVEELRETVGPRHRLTLDAQWSLFRVLRDEEAFDEARTAVEAVVAGRRSMLGDRHSSTVAAMQAQLDLLETIGDDEAATLVRRRIAAATRTP